MDYGFTANGKVYTPNGTTDITPEESKKRNAAIEEKELSLWAEQPASFLAYYSLVSDAQNGKPYRASFRTSGTVSTWLGTQIGEVTEARVYPHNFGARMVSIRVQGDNGARYYGRASYDNGNCVTLRRVR